MKKKSCAVFAAVLTACLCSTGLSVSAYTPDDVAAKAREAGWPENLIQTGYNQWASGNYTQNQLDEAYHSVMEYSEQTEEFIYNQFGIDPEEAREAARKQAAAAETQPVSESVQKPDSSAGSVTQETVPENPVSDNYISDNEFIKMSMEEKQEYVSSLSEEEKTEFVANLSTEARNSIIKQLPAEEKIAIVQKYIDTAGSMGMNVTVDELSEKEISVTVRDNEGIVIDKTGVGIVVDETGISHTKPLVTAGIGILLSSTGFGWLYLRQKEQQT